MGAFPPLVEPGPALPLERLIRYSRQMALPGFDEDAQRRLAAARVLVIGAGGLGSASIPYLASSGVGTIGIVDDDRVELSNLHRQVVHGVADVGDRKTDSIARTIAAIDPEITVNLYPHRVGEAELRRLVAEYDLVVDGSDNFTTRYLCSDVCEALQTPLVWGAILRYSGQASVSWAERGPTYRDLYPVQPGEGEVPNCAQAGVIPGICAVIGALLATETLKVITGLGEPLVGRVTTYNALTGRFREIEYARPDASPHPATTDTSASSAPSVAQTRPVAHTQPVEQARPAPRPGRVTQTPQSGSPSHRTADVEARRRRQAAAHAQITVRQLAEWQRAGTAFQLVDVREPYETRIARIPGSDAIPLGELQAQIAKIRRDQPVVVHCHIGSRSFEAVQYLHEHGFSNAVNLVGGIDAYATQVDTTMVRY